MLTAMLAVVLGLASIALPDALLSWREVPVEPASIRTSNGCPADRAWDDDILAAVLGVSQDQVRKLHVVRGLSAHEICTMPRDKLARALAKVDQPKPDEPGEAARFRAMQQASDDGLVRPDGPINALSQRTALVSRYGLLAAGIDRNSWSTIGPGNIGGRIRSILTHPTDPNLLFRGKRVRRDLEIHERRHDVGARQRFHAQRGDLLDRPRSVGPAAHVRGHRTGARPAADERQRTRAPTGDQAYDRQQEEKRREERRQRCRQRLDLGARQRPYTRDVGCSTGSDWSTFRRLARAVGGQRLL